MTAGAPDNTKGTPMTDSTIQLKRLDRDTARINIKGTAPLICHRWDQKSKQMMLDKQQGKRVAKEAKDPEQQYLSSLYPLPDGDGYGFPSVGFKAATVDAARFYQGVKMTELRRAMFFTGEGDEQLVRINGAPVMREDTVRVGMGTADLRYRGMFTDWTATLSIVYLPAMLSLDTLVALVDAGGMSGVGEWRPGKSSSGSYGTYEVISGE